MKTTLTTIIAVAIFSTCLSQSECSCEDNFLWVKETFEKNDAGFDFALESKSEGAYEAHNATFLKEVKEIEDGSSMECTSTLYDWLTFFRSGHIGISRQSAGQEPGAPASDDDIRASYADWDKRALEEAEFKAYLSELKDPGFEGIWETGPYRIAIKRSGDKYVGSILKADGVYWVKDQVKLQINEDLSGVFYMRNHSESPFDEARLAGTNYLLMGQIDLKRSYPEGDSDEEVEKYFQVMNTSTPFLERYSDNTLILRIPSFSYSEKPLIDSVLEANKEIISSTDNLIIDLRNNGGGSDASYSGLAPFLNTNPVRVVGVQMYSTKLNNSRMLKLAENENYPEEERKWFREKYKLLNDQLGQFVSMNDYPVTVIEMGEVMPYPKRVGILINEGNASTTEQFLLAAKQSQKVKLFGTTTMGVLDISNMYFVPSPCGDFELGYSLSKSMRIPHMAIDGKGIAPDYYLDDDIAPWKWIGFAAEILENQP